MSDIIKEVEIWIYVELCFVFSTKTSRDRTTIFGDINYYFSLLIDKF